MRLCCLPERRAGFCSGVRAGRVRGAGAADARRTEGAEAPLWRRAGATDLEVRRAGATDLEVRRAGVADLEVRRAGTAADSRQGLEKSGAEEYLSNAGAPMIHLLSFVFVCVFILRLIVRL